MMGMGAAPLTRRALLPLILFQLSGALPPAVHMGAAIPRSYSQSFCHGPESLKSSDINDPNEIACRLLAKPQPLETWVSRDLRKCCAPMRLSGGLVEEVTPPAEEKGDKKPIPIDRQNSVSEPEEEGKWRPMCRICYESDQDDLFSPCRCAGSMGYVHRECLRRWRAVKVGERGFTHCPMCDFKYKLRVSASLPPDSLAHNFARWLAQGECAILSTLLCLLVALGGEALDSWGWGTLFRWGPTLAEKVAEAAGAGGGEGAGAGAEGGEAEMPTSSVDGDRVKEMVRGSPETMIWRRLGFNWSIFTVLSTLATMAPFVLGWKGGLGWWVRLRDFVQAEAPVRAAVTSVWVWWIVYAACEVVFIHLHRYPKALGCTLLLYASVALVSVPLQIGVQMMVFEREQPASADVMSVSEADLAEAQASSSRQQTPQAN